MHNASNSLERWNDIEYRMDVRAQANRLNRSINMILLSIGLKKKKSKTRESYDEPKEWHRMSAREIAFSA